MQYDEPLIRGVLEKKTHGASIHSIFQAKRHLPRRAHTAAVFTSIDAIQGEERSPYCTPLTRQHKKYLDQTSLPANKRTPEKYHFNRILHDHLLRRRINEMKDEQAGREVAWSSLHSRIEWLWHELRIPLEEIKHVKTRIFPSYTIRNRQFCISYVGSFYPF